jgi:cell division protein FtsZ
VAQELGSLVVGVVTKPFSFEGSQRTKKALQGIEALRQKVDTLIVIPNDRLMSVSDERLTLDNAFRLADSVLRQGVQAITELILIPGEINLDFADVRAIMENAGPAWMAIGHGKGENRAAQAAEEALNSPLLEVSVAGATGVLLNVTGGSDLTLQEVHEAAEIVSNTVHPDANIIFGTVQAKMDNEVKITLIATGFPVAGEQAPDRSAGAKDALTDEDLAAVPPFLRHHPAAKRLARAASASGNGYSNGNGHANGSGSTNGAASPAPAARPEPAPAPAPTPGRMPVYSANGFKVGVR